jgi:hypothetical protein
MTDILSWFSSVPLGIWQNSTINLAMTTSFQILSIFTFQSFSELLTTYLKKHI